MDIGLGIWTDGGSRYYPMGMLRQKGNAFIAEFDDRRLLIFIQPESATPAALFVDATSVTWSQEEVRLDTGVVVRAGLLVDQNDRPLPLERPQQMFTRWYGFALTFPGCEVQRRIGHALDTLPTQRGRPPRQLRRHHPIGEGEGGCHYLRSALVVLLLWSLTVLAPAFSSSTKCPALSTRLCSLCSVRGLRQIIPGHYIYTRKATVTFNSGVIVTSDGVLVLEAQIDDEVARQVRDAIADVTNQPIRFLVSSTFHRFFSGGVGAYSDAHNIGHEEYRAHLLEALAAEPPDVLKTRLPDQTYRDRVTLHLGGKEIRILHLGRGHTKGDSIIFVPDDRIVYLSELYNHNEFPSLADSYSGDWVAALEVAEALAADVFVPGHGLMTENPRDSRAGMRRFRQLLVDMRQAVQAEIAAGATEDEAVANIALPQYRDYVGYDRGLAGAVRRIYTELTVRLD